MRWFDSNRVQLISMHTFISLDEKFKAVIDTTPFSGTFHINNWDRPRTQEFVKLFQIAGYTTQVFGYTYRNDITYVKTDGDE